MKTILALLTAFTIAGCSTFNAATSTVDMQNPSKAAYAMKATYDATLVLATVYARQPRCGTPNAPLAPFCSERVILDLMLKYSDAADKATQGAEDAVRALGSNPTLMRVAIEGSQKAVTTFQQVTEGVTGKKVQ